MRRSMMIACAVAAVSLGAWIEPAPAQQNQTQQGQRQTRQQQPDQESRRQARQQQQQQQRQSQQQQQAADDVDAVVLLLVRPAVLPPGIQSTRSVDADGIRETLDEVTEAAIEKGGFSEIVDRLVDADRNRIGRYDPDNFRILDGRIAQLQNAWRDKFGTGFNIEEDTVFGAGYENFAIAPGIITNPDRVEGYWPVDPTPNQPGLGAIETSGPGGVAAVNSGDLEDVREETNIQRGREVAVVYVPAEHGLPAMFVSMIDEAFGWKIDVPRGIEGDVLHRNLLNHLTKVGENVDQWPDDPVQAKRFIAHHVLMALYGVPAYGQQDQQHQQQRQQSATQSDQQRDARQRQQRRQQQRETASTTNVRPRAAAVSEQQNRQQIFKTLAAATETALTRGGYDDFIQYLADQDQQRAAQYQQQDLQQINQLVRRVQDLWWDKYGKEFSINNERMTYGNQVSVVQGDINRIAKLTDLPAAAEQVANRISQKVTREEADNVYALVTFPAANGLQEAAVPLVNAEYVGWRIDVPDDVTGQQLRQNLTQRLQRLVDNPDQWPEDDQAAYRFVTHCLLSAAVQPQNQQQQQQQQQQQAQQ